MLYLVDSFQHHIMRLRRQNANFVRQFDECGTKASRESLELVNEGATPKLANECESYMSMNTHTQNVTIHCHVHQKSCPEHRLQLASPMPLNLVGELDFYIPKIKLEAFVGF